MKIAVDESLWLEPRFCRLCARLGWSRPTALGALMLMWHRTRKDRLVQVSRAAICEYLPCQPKEHAAAFDALVEFDYLTDVGEGLFEIEGNSLWVARTAVKSANGSKGQKKAMENMRRAAEIAARAQVISAPPAARKQACIPGTEPQGQTTLDDVWDAYSAAFKARYGSEPPRTGRNSDTLRFFIERVGASEAVAVIEYYVGRDAYRKDGHPVHMAVRDASRLLNATRARNPQQAVAM